MSIMFIVVQECFDSPSHFENSRFHSDGILQSRNLHKRQIFPIRRNDNEENPGKKNKGYKEKKKVLNPNACLPNLCTPLLFHSIRYLVLFVILISKSQKSSVVTPVIDPS